MKRLIGSLLGAVLLAGILTVASASPASAHTDVCVGQGTASLGSPLFYPVVGPAKNTTFSFNLGIGVCASLGSLSASGSISGLLGGAHCGQSTGSGTTNTSHSFSYISGGSILVLSGGVVGVVNAIPDATTGESCTTGADRFLVTGAAALRH